MKLSIYDLLDGYDGEALDIQTGDMAPRTEKIKELTMEKITAQTKKTSPRRGRRRAVCLIAAAVAILALATTAAAVSDWTGFALTGDMSGQAVQSLLDDASVAVAGEMTDADGTTHYYDTGGNETLVLTAEEAAEYQRQQQEEADAAVRASITLLDPDTLELLPSGVTELPVYEDGSFDDFALGNGYMVILYPEGGTGYDLTAGDAVTISLDASGACSLEFGLVLNGAVIQTAALQAKEPSYTFFVPADGSYCFTLLYGSAGADNFTNGQITIEAAE